MILWFQVTAPLKVPVALHVILMNTQGSKGQINAIFCKSIDVIIAYRMRAILTRS